MAKNNESILFSIADLIGKSIKSKSLVQDYPELLAECRKLKISSYTLHLLIENDLKRGEVVPIEPLKTPGFSVRNIQ